MNQAIIADTIFKAFFAWGKSNGIRVTKPNVEFTPINDLYMSVVFIPSKTITPDLAQDMEILQGVIQVDVVAPASLGSTAPAQYAAMAAEFLRGWSQWVDGSLVYINGSPSLFGAIQTKTDYTIPVSGFYRCDYNPIRYNEV
ncbi:tail terminator-like protein [Serratia phage vB_SlqS_ZDD2]|nr:tail terminator-like protein [Serratia phage vB_SlqS_ZDD2]